MTKSHNERRRYRIGEFEYLLDDDDRTAWINEGNCGGAKVYTMPSSVIIEGIEYTITSAEIDAYNTPQDAFLEEVFFPDSYEYFDEYTFYNSPIKKVHLGKGFRWYMHWSLKSAVPDVKVEIDPENPYIKMSDDGNMVLTKDGKTLIYLIHDIPEVIVPEGVEAIARCAVSCNDNLQRLHLPSTLKRIEMDGIIQNRNLKSLMVPEGVTEIGSQAFCNDAGMTLLDLPSTVEKLHTDAIMDDDRLERLILRSPRLVEVEQNRKLWTDAIAFHTCCLSVPENLIPEYRNHPYWSQFEQIEPINDNSSPLEKAWRGIIFEENGLFGMKDIDGQELYPAKFSFIGKCWGHVLFIEPEGTYHKLSPGCEESGYMPEDERPYVNNGKAGFMENGKILIPAEYDYIQKAFGNNSVFLVSKDGRDFYIDGNGREVLTRVRTFDGEQLDDEPFWLRTNSFDYFTVMSYIGREVDNNPNVVRINGEWVELDRYSREEILEMLVDDYDDLPLSMKEIGLLCDHFSYEYSFYFANASGEKPLEKCFRQFSKMGAFDNSWYFTAKLWQAPGNYVSAGELREFRQFLMEQYALGAPVIAVGHDAALKPGEVRILLVTNYYERCFPPQWEFEWYDKSKSMPITNLLKEVPALRQDIDEDVIEECREDDFHGLISDCLEGLEYYEGLDWGETSVAMDCFLELGSGIRNALHTYTSKAYSASLAGQAEKVVFFLRAAIWALERGSSVNATGDSKTVLDIVNDLMTQILDEESKALANTLRDELLAKGAVTNAERISNTDYYKELEYLRG